MPETHVAWLLRPSKTLLVATPAYLKKNGTPSSPEQLSDHNCLTYLRPSAKHAWVFESGQRKKERRSVTITGNFCANNSEALRELVSAGTGIALLPDFSAQSDIQTGRLVHLLPTWKPVGVFGDAIYAIRPYSTHVPRAVRVFVSYLKEVLAVA